MFIRMFSKDPKNHSVGILLPQESLKANSPISFEAFELNEIEEIEVVHL